jgi:hypothetical protein
MAEDDAGVQNKVVVSSGRSLLVGNERFEIVDRSDGVRFVDLFTEAFQINGVVYLSLGSGIREFGNPPVVEVSTRIRMSLAMAQNIHTVLGNLIREAQTPPDKLVTN